jgi:hypothetical protein
LRKEKIPLKLIFEINLDIADSAFWYTNYLVKRREAVTVIRIPKGTDITAYKGLASPQLGKTEQLFNGDGVQYRFRDFDPNWIVETRSLYK